ncbi:hypothetical protein [Arthrobacter gengyunqii]|uniref:Lipoprotein n=1 Tax=Arthrobacter gengyunqii TaxID=2886940 RepID=A0ABS8GIG2_9MICC|nr:hypothetical protein [Arthrobacter gengyunqii]MCC3266427.1 hypothetical protein [Arthrobacter gengyunqii]
MKKSMKAGALLVAGVFALSGCGSSDDGSKAASESSPSATATPTPTLAVGQSQYTPEELEAALQAVKADQGLSGEIANQEMLSPLLQEAPDALAGVTITPEKCDVLATTDIAGILESANMAMLMLTATDMLMIASHPDESVMEKQFADNSLLLEECAQFQMEAAGQVMTASIEPVDATTDAEQTQAFRTAITAGEEVTESTQLSVVSGTTNIQITLNGPEGGASMSKAEDLANALLAELAK